MSASKTKKTIQKLLLALIIIFTLTTLTLYYLYFIRSSVHINGPEKAYLYIPSSATIEAKVSILTKNQQLSLPIFFEGLITQASHYKTVKAGRYELENGMSAAELIRILLSGRQQAVKFTFNNIRFLPKLASMASQKLEIDSSELMALLSNNEYLQPLGFNSQTVLAMFIPNTYELYWNTDEKEFIEKMHRSYQSFWTEERKQKADALNLSLIEVSILASIVEEETNQKDEMARIAGVYYNRLRKKMLLQADPTARFAYGDFAVKRITYDYLKIDSPYNTYKYLGLPPGPICMPRPSTIDSVLELEHHNYIFFCALPNQSGYHSFSANYAEHQKKAAAYHRYLNKIL
jgi:UPF0755 protein